MGTVTVKDGTTIDYKDWGKGPVVTLSHGWPRTSRWLATRPAAVKSPAKSVKLIKGAVEICYPGLPHGLTATHPDIVNPTCSRSASRTSGKSRDPHQVRQRHLVPLSSHNSD